MTIEINGNQYKTCLFDTNIISEVVKNREGEFAQFVLLITQKSYIPCFSIFSILELRQKKHLYEGFLDTFSLIPCIFLKNHEQLFVDEISLYPNYEKVNPYTTTYLGPLAPPGEKLKDLLKKLFQNPEIIALENQWNAGKASIIEGILKLKSNFPPKGEKYTDKEIREFVKYAMVTQIGFQDRDFARKIVNSRKVIDTDKFPSRKMILYSVFYKFYVDNRKPMISDAFDLIIGAPTPYMDAIVIEKHQAEIIKKVKRNDGFLDHLEVLTIREIRKI